MYLAVQRRFAQQLKVPTCIHALELIRASTVAILISVNIADFCKQHSHFVCIGLKRGDKQDRGAGKEAWYT